MKELKSELAGFFKFEAVNAETGEKRLLADWHKNLITNAGLERMGSQPVIQRVQVGSGQTAPSVNDTALVSFVAQTSSTQGSRVYGATTIAPFYGFGRQTFRFPMGAAAGNLSEVGILDNGSGAPLFSRSLIRDGNGNPTTITVLANEFLDVTYEIRIYAPTADVTSQFQLDGTTYNCTLRAARCGDAAWWQPNIFDSRVEAIPGTAGQGFIAFSGPIGGVTEGPGGSTATCGRVREAYSANSRYVEVHGDLGLTEGNFPGGVRSLLFSSNVGSYQVEFNPPIPKDNTRTLRLTVRFHWARQP